MLINNESNHVKFISYTGKYPTLCMGVLTLEIDGKKITFGYNYETRKDSDYPCFWSSGGSCGFKNDYSETYIKTSEWEIDVEALPEEYQKYAAEIDEVFNSFVYHGCCGGCI